MEDAGALGEDVGGGGGGAAIERRRRVDAVSQRIVGGVGTDADVRFVFVLVLRSTFGVRNPQSAMRKPAARVR